MICLAALRHRQYPPRGNTIIKFMRDIGAYRLRIIIIRLQVYTHYQNIYKSTLSNNKQGSIEAANIFKEAIAPYMGQSLEEELGTSYTKTKY